MGKTGAFLAGVGLVCSVGAPSRGAHAAAGDHIRTGNAVITPYVGLSGNFRSNAYFSEGVTGNGDPVQSGVFLELTPGIDLELKSDDLNFDLGFEYNPRKYLNKKASSLDRFTDVAVKTRLHLLPLSVVGVAVEDRFEVVSRETEAETAETANLRRTYNDAGAQVVLQPGASMQVNLGGAFQYENYAVPRSFNALGIANLNTRTELGPTAGVNWRFLPKTALSADFSYGVINWENNFVYLGDGKPGVDSNGGVYGDYLGKPDGTTWRAEAALRGRFTSKTVLGLGLGYGQLTGDDESVILDGANEVEAGSEELDPIASGFGEDLRGIAGLLVNLNAQYDFFEGQRVVVGYTKDFQDPYFANFVAYNSFFGRYTGLFAERLDATLGGQVRLEDYGGEAYRGDVFVTFDAGLGYRVTKALDLSLGTKWMRRASTDGGKIAARNAGQEYDNVDVSLGLKFTY